MEKKKKEEAQRRSRKKIEMLNESIAGVTGDEEITNMDFN